MNQSPSEIPEADLVRLQIDAAVDLKLKVLEARESILGLYKLLFTDPQGQPIVLKDFHYAWEKGLFAYPSVLYEASRGLTKTSFMIAAVLWMIGRNPNIRVKWLGNNDANAQKRLAVMHEVIDNPDHIYHKVFPLVAKCTRDSKRPNNSSMLSLEREMTSPDPTVEALGIMSSGAGGRCDLMILDDIIDEKNAILNPSMKQKVLRRLQLEWLPLRVKGARTWCIFTPWAEDDANAYLKKNSGWFYLKYAHGTLEDPYHSIFPEICSDAMLKQFRLDMGESLYNLAYRCMTMAPDSVPILPEHLVMYDQFTLTPQKVAESKVFLVVDPSTGKKLHKGDLDYTGLVIFLLWLSPDRKQYQIFVVEAFQCRIPKALIARHAWTLAEQWQAEAILGEDEGMQVTTDDLKEERRQNFKHLNQIKVISVSSKNQSKGQRLLDVTKYLNLPEGVDPVVYFHPKAIEAGPQPFQLQLPDGTYREGLRDLREQLLSFPTKHDDIMDPFVHGIRWMEPKYLQGKKAAAQTEIAIHTLTTQGGTPSAAEPEAKPQPELDYRRMRPSERRKYFRPLP